MGEVVQLLSRKRLAREQADAFRQMAFEFDLPDDMRAEIDNAIYRLTEESGERWPFVKISPEQFRYVIKAIRETARPDQTLQVWNAAITYMRDAENAQCARGAWEEGMVCVPHGRGSQGSLGCRCHFTSTEHQANSIARSQERARKQEEEWVRKGGKPDLSNGNKPK